MNRFFFTHALIINNGNLLKTPAFSYYYFQNATSTDINNYDSRKHMFINRPSSDSVSSLRGSEFVVDNLEIWDAKKEMIEACGLWPIYAGIDRNSDQLFQL